MSWASAIPNGVRVLWYECTCTFAFVLRSVSTSEGLASQMKSLCPVRNAAIRVAASGVERITYSSTYGRPLSQ